MKLPPITTEPRHASYDVVIVGGAIMGSSVAWHLSSNPNFDGKVLVVERDPSYERSSTAGTNSCVRQQFSNEINIRVSQYAVEAIQNFRELLGGDPEVPEIALNSYGYLYLADNEDFAAVLRENQKLQAACGAGTRILIPDEIAEAYPFYNLDGIILGSHNPLNEGYFDGATMFDWWRRKARQNGIEYITNEVVAMSRGGGGIESVTLKSGEVVAAGKVVNASGPRASLTAEMAGLSVPVEPRPRYTFIFDAQEPLDRTLPLTIDPSGVHMRDDGAHYLCGCPPDPDPAVDHDDFTFDHSIWEEKLWPTIATRVPAFEAVKVVNSWICHYAYNAFDQNAIVGPHPEVPNFLFLNGFSGHGLQQSPAMGRGVSEIIVYGEYRELDLTPFGVERILRNERFLEKAII